MNKLQELFSKVKEENLTKWQLEELHQALSTLRGEMRLELATITKKKAVYMLGKPELAVAQRKINWSATEEGLREIDLKAEIGALGDNLNSIKSRLFNTY